MKNYQLIFTLLCSILLFSCDSLDSILPTNHGNGGNCGLEDRSSENTALLIIDAQKYYIPGHPESVQPNNDTFYVDYMRIINAMDTVMAFANQKNLPTFVTYEALDSGRFAMPDKMIERLSAASESHEFIKYYYGALEHNKIRNTIIRPDIEHIIVIGAEIDVCVYQTVKQLLNEGKTVSLVKDAIYTKKVNPYISLQNLKDMGAGLISIKQVYKDNYPVERNAELTIERPIMFEKTKLFIINDSVSISPTEGYNLRKKYLEDFAGITSMAVEFVNTNTNPDWLQINADEQALIAGSLNSQTVEYINESDHYTRIVTDALLTSETPETDSDTRNLTTKIFFFELTKTVQIFVPPFIELSPWHIAMRNAIFTGELPLVDNQQNIE